MTLHTVELIASALSTDDHDRPTLPPAEPQDGICCITGRSGPSLPRRMLLGPSFTSGALLVAPHSDRVSVSAYITLKYPWERKSSWYVDTSGFVRLTRKDVRERILSRQWNAPWAMYVTTTWKKHGALHTPVNGSPGSAIIGFDDGRVDLSDAARVVDMWSRLRDAQDSGIGRSVIETLDAPSWLIKQVGIKRWLAFEAWARPIYTSPIYCLLCYLLPSRDELTAQKSNALLL